MHEVPSLAILTVKACSDRGVARGEGGSRQRKCLNASPTLSALLQLGHWHHQPSHSASHPGSCWSKCHTLKRVLLYRKPQ